MTSLSAVGKITTKLLRNATPVITTVRNHGWNKDYMAGPYPKTAAERIAAAKKYDIPLEEYEPYPDDGDGCGDYPKLPVISGEYKDPFYPWDYPELKRNFEETIHENFDYMREDRVDTNLRLRHPRWVLFLQWFGTISVLGILGWWTPKCYQPLMARQYPEEGKKHYTFETC